MKITNAMRIIAQEETKKVAEIAGLGSSQTDDVHEAILKALARYYKVVNNVK